MLAHLRHDPTTGHHSLHASAPLRQGHVLSPFSAMEVMDQPTRFTLQLDGNTHILLSPEPLWYCNHSCAPNIFFDTEAMEVVCLEDIAEGEELRFFYPSTEWSMAEPFACFCGAPGCLGRISGAADLPDEVLEKYRLNHFVVNKWLERQGQKVTREV
jgi:hypothetical protein